MLNTPLPRHADLRKLVASGARVAGTVALADLPRIGATLLSHTGVARVDLQCWIDEDRLRVISGSIVAELEMECQRCLEPMQYAVDAAVAIALVWEEKEIASLPERLDGVVVGAEPHNLFDLVEEEILLALPLAPRHAEGKCSVRDFVPDDSDGPQHGVLRPFAHLAGLKGGSS